MPDSATYSLKDGILYRDNQPLQCPFATRLLMPVQTKLQGNGIGINTQMCGSWCAKFQVEDFPCGEDPLIHVARLQCGGCLSGYKLDSVASTNQATRKLVN